MEGGVLVLRVIYPVSFVGLPIGNREDITRRALQVLEGVDCICCEDTRNTGMLLSHYGIKKPLLSLHEHNETARAPEIAARALAGERFAVVTDAGMPGVSDPGYRLIQELKAREVAFTVLPGPSAVVTALVGSGLPCDAFFFGGFLPVKSGKKGQVLQNMCDQKGLMISTGSACSSKKMGNRVLENIGYSKDEVLGNVRISFSRYTSNL